MLSKETRLKIRKNLVNFRHIVLPCGDDEVESAPFHYDWSDVLLNGTRNIAIEGFRESAKALSLETEIPTFQKGFKQIKDLQVGDKIFDLNGDPCEITHISEVFKHRECFKMCFDDGIEIVADKDHRWYVWDKKRRKYEIHNTKYLSETYQGWEHKNGYQERRYRVPVCGVVKYPKKKLPLDPYILGIWLGDGNKDCPIFTINSKDVDTIKNVFERKGYHLKELPSSKDRYSITGERHNFQEVLMNKHIPDDYLHSDIGDRLELLRGLIDSDGTLATEKRKQGTITFSSSIPELASNTLELIRSLGIKATMISGIPKLNGVEYKRNYRISFKTHLKVSYLPRRDNTQFPVNIRSKFRTLINVRKIGKMDTKCLAVNGTQNVFLATRSYLPTHNTQYVLRSYPAYALAFPDKRRDYIVIIKNNTTLARNKLKEIEREYLTNPLVSHNLAEIVEQSADVFSVDVQSETGEIMNIRIEAYGKGASIRGLANIDRKPKIVIGDDLQDIEDAMSQTVSESDWKWFMSDVYFLGQSTRIFLIGNNLGERCIIERVFAEHEALGFDVMRVPCLIDGESAWPARFSKEEIKEEKDNFRKLAQLDIWYREKMCEALAEETRIFQRDDVRWYASIMAEKIAKNCNVFIRVDPAFSTKEAADYTAIVIFGIDEKNNWFIFDVLYGRWDTDRKIDEIFKAVPKWNPMNVGIEETGAQKMLKDFVIKEMPKRNVFFSLVDLKADRKKEERIMLLQPRFKAHTIYFPEEAPWLTEMMTELLMFTREGAKSLQDDLIDALSFGFQESHAPFKKVSRETLLKSQNAVTECQLI